MRFQMVAIRQQLAFGNFTMQMFVVEFFTFKDKVRYAYNFLFSFKWSKSKAQHVMGNSREQGCIHRFDFDGVDFFLTAFSCSISLPSILLLQPVAPVF